MFQSVPMRYHGFRQWVAAVLTAQDPNNRVTKIVNVSLFILIATNGIALILETVASIYSQSPQSFALFEKISIYIFSAEYVLRIWSCTTLPEFRGAIRGRLRFVFSAMAIIDVLAILPFYLPVLGFDFRSARLLRLFRLFRMFKLVRYSRTLKLFARVVRSKREELITILIFLGVMLIVTATLVYYAETKSQPEIFSSIPAAMWWAVATLTTVGYGDMYPITEIGRVLGAIIAVLGIGLFALPASILGSAFIEEVQRKNENQCISCPHCGKEINKDKKE